MRILHISDIHLTEGKPGVIRDKGTLLKLDMYGPVDITEIDSFVHDNMELIAEEYDKLRDGNRLLGIDYAVEYNEHRMRVNIYKGMNGMSLALRVLSSTIFTPQQLRLPPSAMKFTQMKDGLILVVGTTGWNDKKDEVNKFAADCGGVIMTSANFSIGVNMFYKIVAEAAKIMSEFSEYDVATWEAHHNQKADSPSGTAIEIAKRIMENNPNKTQMVVDAFHERPAANELHVSSTRCGNIPGTHKVFFDSNADTIELTHTARSREGFANGAVKALEKLSSAVKTGILTKGKLYGMEDLF